MPLVVPGRVDRCTYRRRKSFRTVSNKVRKVKTPGGKLVLHYTGKKGKSPNCGDAGCEKRLHGVRARPPPLHEGRLWPRHPCGHTRDATVQLPADSPATAPLNAQAAAKHGGSGRQSCSRGRAAVWLVQQLTSGGGVVPCCWEAERLQLGCGAATLQRTPCTTACRLAREAEATAAAAAAKAISADGRDAHLAPTPRLPPQIPALRPVEYSRISKRQKKVSRAYGGSRCANCVRMRCAAAPKPRPPRAGRTRLPGRWARHAPRLVWSSHAAALQQRDARARTHAWPACMRADARTLRSWLRRIVRAFLIEEQKIVKKVLKSQAAGAK